MTEKKGIRVQGRPCYEPPCVVRLGAAADGRGLQWCGNGSSNEYVCVSGASAGGSSCDNGSSPV